MKFDLYDTKLENFTGVSKTACEKDSVRCFSDIKSTRTIPIQHTSHKRPDDRTDDPEQHTSDRACERDRFDPNDKYASKPLADYNRRT